MESYDKFLRLIKDGWEGIIEFPKVEKIKKKKILKPKSVAFSMAFLGDIGGAALADSLNNLNSTENARFKIIENGIFIQIRKFRKEELLIKWDEIITINNKRNKSYPDLTLFKLVDGRELTLSAPFKEGFTKTEYFTDYFIDYVNERTCGKIQIDNNEMN